MRLTRTLTAYAGAALLAASLTACGGDAASADFTKLIQDGDFQGAIAAIEPALATVAKGTDEHKDLLIGYTEALAAETPDKAKDTFLAAMSANKEFIQPNDIKYVVARMADQGHLQQALDVMNAGDKAYPENETIKVVIDSLKKAIESSGDDAAMAKLKSMGYLGGDE